MAVCFVIDTPGGTEELYDRVIKHVKGSGAFPPEGHIFQAAGPIDGAWRVVDVWQSQEDFDRFMTERLGPALAEASAPQPEVRHFSVRNHFGGASATAA